MTISAALREHAETPDRFSEIPAGASVRRGRLKRLGFEDVCTIRRLQDSAR